MATLRSGELTLEIRYTLRDAAGWLHYALCFRWRGELLVRPELLERPSADWDRRAPGAFHANVFERDTLLPVLRHVLDSRAAAAWEPPDDPDVCLAFYPGQAFPPQVAPVSSFRGTGVLLVAQADVNGLAGSDGYTGEGPALVMQVTLADLAQFYADLRDEYAALDSEPG